jgi:histidine kinase
VPSWPDLVSLAVHELRTPANVLGGYVKMLLAGHGGPLTDLQRQALQNADAAGARLVEILAEVSELARLDDGRLALRAERVALADLLADARARFVAPAESRAVCAIGVKPPQADVCLDRQRAARGLGALARTVLRRRPDAAVLLLQARVHEDHAWLTVADATTPVESPYLEGLGPLDALGGGEGVALPLALKVFGAAGGVVGVPRAGAHEGAIAVRLPLA